MLKQHPWAPPSPACLTGSSLCPVTDKPAPGVQRVFSLPISHRKGATSAHCADRETETWMLRTVLKVTERGSGRSRNRGFGGWSSLPTPARGRSQLGWGWGQTHLYLAGPMSPSVRVRLGHLSRTELPPRLVGREALTRMLSDWPLLASWQLTFYPRPLFLPQREGRP